MPLFLKLRDGYLNLDLISTVAPLPEGCHITFQSGDQCRIEGSATEHLDKLVDSRRGVALPSAQPEEEAGEGLESIEFVQRLSDHEYLVGYRSHDAVSVTEGVPGLIEELDSSSTVDPNRVYLTWNLRAAESGTDPAA